MKSQTAKPQTGRLEAIWIKRAHGGVMDEADSAALKTGAGIVGNADQGGRRQVTLLSAEQWAKVVGDEVSPQIRRANLLVSGLELEDSRDWKVRIGEVEMLVSGETKPCRLMDELSPGLQDALQPNWGGGAYAQVLTDGEIKVGDQIVLEPPAG